MHVYLKVIPNSCAEIYSHKDLKRIATQRKELVENVQESLELWNKNTFDTNIAGPLPDVFVSVCGCWAPIGAVWRLCVPIGAAGCSPWVPIGVDCIPWALIGAGCIPCAPIGADWMPWICRAWEASTVISCIGFRWTVEATPTLVWAVIAELGACADTEKQQQKLTLLHKIKCIILYCQATIPKLCI